MTSKSRFDQEVGQGEPETQVSLGSAKIIRSLRLWSGLILFAFLTMHLLNHALGLFGLAALDIGQTFRWALWMNPVGITLLYGALAVHFLLACWKVVSRRTWRMPLDEAAQLGLGLLIPILLLPHVMNTRVVGTWLGGSGFYEVVLAGLWPQNAIWQIILIVVAWSHGVLGLMMAFRHNRWFHRIRIAGFVVALLVPTLAISGFVAGGREVAQRPASPPSPERLVQQSVLADWQKYAWYGLAALGALLAGIVKAGYISRRIGNKIVITYRGRGPIRVPVGSSILEASRLNGIPHPSLCRGRGRCSTCRVQILSNPDELPPPSTLEQATLDRSGSVNNVRLACQLRPQSDISVRILLPVLGRAADPDSQAEAERWAAERVATTLALDLRAFNVLVQSRLPYELVALVNRFGSEMRQAVENHGGVVSTFHGDGLVAVFDDPRHERFGARNALAAARDMDRALRNLSREMGGALPIPVRAGIGIHTGRVTLARVGMSDRDSAVMAFGASVTIAAGLQKATLSALADCLCSEETARLAKIGAKTSPVLDIQIDGMDNATRAIAILDWQAIGMIEPGQDEGEIKTPSSEAEVVKAG